MPQEPISPEELAGYVQTEIQRAESDQGTVASNREEALRRFKGEPLGDEEDGRSKALARDTLETVMHILPQLVEIFMTEEESILFRPINEGDVEQAKQETAYVRHVFWEENPGFLNMLSLTQDALIQKIGVVKAYWDTAERVKGETYYENLTYEQLEMLLAHEDVEISGEVEEQLSDDPRTPPLYNVKTLLLDRNGRESITVFPPEDLIVSEDVRSINLNECRFVAHRSRRRRGDLVESGFNYYQVYSLGAEKDARRFDAQQAARYNETEEDPIRSNQSIEMSTHELEVFECYYLIDQDGDGIPERHKVFYCQGELLEHALPEGTQPEEEYNELTSETEYFMPDGELYNEIVTHVPLYPVCPYILSHKLHGMSVYDMVKEIELQRTALLRGQFDNIYRTNNPEIALDEDRAEYDDFLESEVGGIKRTQGNPHEIVMPLVVPFAAEKSFPMHELMDQQKRRRTGAGDGVAGLDDKSLADVNTGVAQMAQRVEQQMVRLIARSFAETGLTDMFLGIHRDLKTHQRQQRVARLTGEWVPVDPSSWIDRDGVDVDVGLGSAVKELTLVAMKMVMEDQQVLLQSGLDGVLVAPENLYNARKRMLQSLGIKAVSEFYVDPASPAGQQAAQAKAMQAQQAAAQQEQQVQTMVATDLQKHMVSEANKADETQRKANKDIADDELKRTELELQYRQNIPGGLPAGQVKGNGATKAE